MISKWKSFFLAQEMIISKTYEIIFVALLEMISEKLEMVCTECWSYCSWKWFLHTSKMISWLRWENVTRKMEHKWCFLQLLSVCKNLLTSPHNLLACQNLIVMIKNVFKIWSWWSKNVFKNLIVMIKKCKSFPNGNDVLPVPKNDFHLKIIFSKSFTATKKTFLAVFCRK